MEKKEAMKSIIYGRVREGLDLSREMEDEEISELIHKVIAAESENQYISFRQKEEIAKAVFASVRKLDILQELIDDDEITEVMVNGPDRKSVV